MRRTRISTKDKLDFWERHHELAFKEFVELARGTFNYSPKTIPDDIYYSFKRVAEKSGWGTRNQEIYKDK